MNFTTTKKRRRSASRRQAKRCYSKLRCAVFVDSSLALGMTTKGVILNGAKRSEESTAQKRAIRN
ncbi:MAG: hypothetical protein NZM06_02775 [Chloroherpetonaceae bacterium]|nr:hypothetical protein [Chloroherpetonaceae bacterium]